MIVIDACVVISFLAGEDTPQTRRFRQLPLEADAVLAPSTVTELLSDPAGGESAAALIEGLDLIPLADGHWARAGRLRARLRRSGRKAALGHALAAQACLDSGLALLTADADFRAFAVLAGLRLAEPA